MDHNHRRSGQVVLQVPISSSNNNTCFPCLSELQIKRCPKLEAKPYLPSSLESLVLEKSNEQLLLSPFHQGQGCWSSNDVGLLPPSFGHLKVLELFGMTAAESRSGCGWELLQHLTALESLTLFCCDGLRELPESMRSLTSLRSLRISWCSALRVLPNWLGGLRSLQEMTIRYCGSLRSLPPFMQVQHLAGSLQVLSIAGCGALHQLPEWLGELRSLRRLEIGGSPFLRSLAQLSLPHLATSLQVLRISSFRALDQLPEWLWELRALRKLELCYLPGLTCLPQSMCRLTSLERLRITRCKGITSLPVEIQGLTALKELIIFDCPDLKRHCERGKGQDWHLISHIPFVFVHPKEER